MSGMWSREVINRSAGMISGVDRSCFLVLEKHRASWIVVVFKETALYLLSFLHTFACVQSVKHHRKAYKSLSCCVWISQYVIFDWVANCAKIWACILPGIFKYPGDHCSTQEIPRDFNWWNLTVIVPHTRAPRGSGCVAQCFWPEIGRHVKRDNSRHLKRLGCL